MAEAAAGGEAPTASSQDLGSPSPTGNELPVGAEEMIAELKKLLAVNDDVFPVPWLPPPPPPLSRSRRPRARYAKCMAVRQVAERAWLSLNEAGAYVPGEARSEEVRPVRISSANMREQHAAIWKMLMKECRRMLRARRTSFAEVPTGASLIRDMVRSCSDHDREPKGAERYED